jgi:aminodeoxychorismate lyase
MNPASITDALPTVYGCNQFLPAKEAAVSIFDRGVSYGDGLFETIRLHHGLPLHWPLHFTRFQSGADFLHIPLPQTSPELLDLAAQLAHRNAAPNAILRLLLTRGVSPRGYSTARANRPSLFLSLHPAPAIDIHTPTQRHLITSTIRIAPDDPLTRFKTCNRLPYILARHQAEAQSADDALILNSRGEIVEASSANLWLIHRDQLLTPSLDCGALPGVTRAVLLRLATQLGVPAREAVLLPRDLRSADGVFLSVSACGIVEVITLDQQPLPRAPLVQQFHAAYWQAALPLATTHADAHPILPASA